MQKPGKNIPLLYFGESRELSDLWLVSLLKKYFDLTLSLGDKEDIPSRKAKGVVVNRMYTSFYSRYGKRSLNVALIGLEKIESKKIPIVNSLRGYKLDLDRINQMRFFRKHGINYVPVFPARKRYLKKIKTSFVLKLNPSGRNNFLPLMHGWHDLRGTPYSIRKRSIIQVFIPARTCFRTEIIGYFSFTFSQLVERRGDKVFFKRKDKVIPTPVSDVFLKKISSALGEMGVKVFSIEYFILNDVPCIIDFNLSSNYKRFFIEKSGVRKGIQKAWLKVVYETLKTNDTSR